jgi:hypothetical protein
MRFRSVRVKRLPLFVQVNAILLNEFLKEHKRVEQTIAQLKSEATKQEAAGMN